MTLSRNVFEIFDVKEYSDLEIQVRGHSRSSKVTPFDSLYVYDFLLPSYSNIVCRVQRFRDIAIYWSKIAKKKPTPPSFDAPSPANTREYPHKPYTARNCDLWPTFLPLIVWVYAHSYFYGGLSKTDV